MLRLSERPLTSAYHCQKHRFSGIITYGNANFTQHQWPSPSLLAPCLKVIISLSSLSCACICFPLKLNCKEHTCWQVTMRATSVLGEQQARCYKSCQFSPHECLQKKRKLIKPILLVTQNKTMKLKMSTTCLFQCLVINVERLLPQQPRQKDPHPL